MINLSKTKVPMPEQAPEVRAHNFREVALGYTPGQAETQGLFLQFRQRLASLTAISSV